MPIEWQTYQKLRQLYLVEKKSIRTIAKDMGMSRKTIRKYCRGGVLPDVRKNTERDSKIRCTVEEDILRLLEENKTMPIKQRRNAKDIWEYLLSEKGVAVGESTIRRYVRELRNRHPEVFLPLSHEPGESLQFDWGDMVAVIGEVKTAVSVFCAVLPYSCNILAFPYPNKSMVCFLDGHIRTFQQLGGVTRYCVYDNLKTAVLKGSGKNAVKQKEFIRLEAHYGFESVFCNVASGWEKGNVENAVAIVRRIAFTPIPRVKSYAELEDHITNCCLHYAQTHRIHGRERSIKELFTEETQQLLCLPDVPLDTGFTTTAFVASDLTVLYDTTKYSVPRYLVGKQVTLKISPFHLEVYYEGHEIFKHDRTLKKQDHRYVLEHYLEILERKPRAVNQAVVLKQGIMPEECKEFLRICQESDCKQQLVDILLLGRDVEREKLLWAIGQANNTHSPSLGMVRLFLDLKEPTPPKDDLVVEHKGLGIYDALITEGGLNHECNPT